jgi:hypothetical protein
MTNALQTVLRRVGTAVALPLLVTASGVAHAALYAYQGADGSWMFTDHAINTYQYRLVHKSEDTRGHVGGVQYSTFHRGDPSAYDGLIEKMARAYGVEPALVKAVMHVESAFNRFATSRKGASGLMQLMPATAEQYGVHDVYDPTQNVRAGVSYLHDLIERFNNDLQLALAAYNAGEDAVQQHNGVPPYPETRDYVKRVLEFKQRYAGEF